MKLTDLSSIEVRILDDLYNERNERAKYAARIVKNLGCSWGGINISLKELVRMSLIERVPQQVGTLKKFFKLTKYGQDVASLINQLNEKLGEKSVHRRN